MIYKIQESITKRKKEDLNPEASEKTVALDYLGYEKKYGGILNGKFILNILSRDVHNL